MCPRGFGAGLVRHKFGVMRSDAIVIVPYDFDWPQAFERERALIEDALSPVIVRPIEHIGSTSVPGLPAKAIIDMLAVVATIDDVTKGRRANLEAVGWLHAPEQEDAEDRRLSYCTPTIEHRTHHLHIVEERLVDWRGWIAFRDYLRTHPEIASQYAELKRSLAAAHGADPNDRSAYRAGKATFVEHVTAAALHESR
jgi:GrpB-like predicted nucleotidyltransferase (UPF0157 family)